jgi:hypothetical protein
MYKFERGLWRCKTGAPVTLTAHFVKKMCENAHGHECIGIKIVTSFVQLT